MNKAKPRINWFTIKRFDSLKFLIKVLNDNHIVVTESSNGELMYAKIDGVTDESSFRQEVRSNWVLRGRLELLNNNRA